MRTQIREIIENEKVNSAWSKGVKLYAIELLDSLESEEVTKELLLNGATSWAEYSDGGCALICDCDIAERLCTPSELKKNKGGENNPNREESWLNVQSRALRQASNMIINTKRTIERA